LAVLRSSADKISGFFSTDVFFDAGAVEEMNSMSESPSAACALWLGFLDFDLALVVGSKGSLEVPKVSSSELSDSSMMIFGPEGEVEECFIAALAFSRTLRIAAKPAFVFAAVDPDRV